MSDKTRLEKNNQDLQALKTSINNLPDYQAIEPIYAKTDYSIAIVPGSYTYKVDNYLLYQYYSSSKYVIDLYKLNDDKDEYELIETYIPTTTSQSFYSYFPILNTEKYILISNYQTTSENNYINITFDKRVNKDLNIIENIENPIVFSVKFYASHGSSSHGCTYIDDYKIAVMTMYRDDNISTLGFVEYNEINNTIEMTKYIDSESSLFYGWQNSSFYEDDIQFINKNYCFLPATSGNNTIGLNIKYFDAENNTSANISYTNKLSPNYLGTKCFKNGNVYEFNKTTVGNLIKENAYTDILTLLGATVSSSVWIIALNNPTYYIVQYYISNYYSSLTYNYCLVKFDEDTNTFIPLTEKISVSQGNWVSWKCQNGLFNRSGIYQLLEDSDRQIALRVGSKTYYSSLQVPQVSSSDVLVGRDTYTRNLEKVIGTMPNNGALNITPSAIDQTIPVGYTSGGTISGDANLVQANIRAGVSIFGVEGNLEPDKPDQTKNCTPTTSQQVIEPDVGYELASVTINAVDNTIDQNITAGNIKKDVEILGVVGTLESGSSGDVKLFATEQAMQADPNPSEGDLAVVYREEVTSVTEESEFDSCTFPNEVVLSEAFTSNISGRFRSTGGGSFDGMVELSSSSFVFDSWGDTMVRVQYTSNDGITYTRTDGGEELQEFGTTIKWESWGYPFNDVIGNFMKIGGNYFEGFYKYGTYENNKAIKLYLNATRLVDDSTAEISIKLGASTSVKVPKLIKILQEYLSTTHKENFSFVIVRETDDIYNVYMTNLTYTPPNITPLNDRVYITRTDSGSAVTSMTKVTINLITETYNYQDITYTKIWESGSYWIGSYEDITDKLFTAINMQNGIFNCGTFEACTVNYAGTGIYDYSFPMELGEFTDYNIENTQLDATLDYVYEKTFYGKNGVENGALTTNISNTFTDINGEIYGKIQAYYNTLTPRVLTDQDKTIDTNIKIIPVKSDGTPLLDTSSVTSMYYMFSNCTSLTTIPLLDTSNVTDMCDMFYNCTSLTTIPLLDTSNVTNMYNMFFRCTSLTTIPLLNTSNVTNMYGIFDGCTSLNNGSLNNILVMCTNATKITSNKTLRYIGLTYAQATICQGLSNYSAFTSAGWTTGY